MLFVCISVIMEDKIVLPHCHCVPPAKSILPETMTGRTHGKLHAAIHFPLSTIHINQNLDPPTLVTMFYLKIQKVTFNLIVTRSIKNIIYFLQPLFLQTFYPPKLQQLLKQRPIFQLRQTHPTVTKYILANTLLSKQRKRTSGHFFLMDIDEKIFNKILTFRTQ